MKNYIDVLVEELKKGYDPLTVLAAFVAAWSTVDSSNILSTQIRRRLGLTYMGNIQQAISSLISKMSSDPNFNRKAVEVLALAIERDWVRNALKEAAWRGVAQQLKSAAEALYNAHRSYSTKIFLEDIESIIKSQQVKSMFDYGAPSQPSYGAQPPVQYPGTQQVPSTQQYPHQYPGAPPAQGVPSPQAPPPQPTGQQFPPQYPPKPQPSQGSPPTVGTKPASQVPPPTTTTFPPRRGPRATPSSTQPAVPSASKLAPPEASTSKAVTSDDLALFRDEIVRQIDTLQIRFSQFTDEIKKLRSDFSPLLETDKIIRNLSSQLNAIMNTIKQLSSKYEELRSLIDTINVQVARKVDEINLKFEMLKKEIEELKQRSVSAPPVSTPPSTDVAEEIKETVSELFDLIDVETEVAELESQKPTDFQSMVSAKMEEYYSKKAEAGEIKVPPYVFIVAIGNISRLKEILGGGEVPGYVGRWSFTITEGGKKSKVYIQALHREISNNILNESLNLGDGILVLSPIKNIAALNNALSRLADRMNKCKFIMIDANKKPRGLKVPGKLKVITKKIENKDTISELIKSEIFPIF